MLAALSEPVSYVTVRAQFSDRITDNLLKRKIIDSEELLAPPSGPVPGLANKGSDNRHR